MYFYYLLLPAFALWIYWTALCIHFETVLADLKLAVAAVLARTGL